MVWLNRYQMGGSIRNDQVVSLYGRIEAVFLPVEALVNIAEISRALVAWRYGLLQQEVELLEYVALGLTNAEIAARSKVAEEATIKNRLRVVFHKLGVANRNRAAAIAFRYGLGVE